MRIEDRQFLFEKVVFSEAGILKQSLWSKKMYSWDQVIQVGLMPLDWDSSVKQFAFTFIGGCPWDGKVTRKWWMAKNGKTGISAKFSVALYDLVLKCYGSLDF